MRLINFTLELTLDEYVNVLHHVESTSDSRVSMDMTKKPATRKTISSKTQYVYVVEISADIESFAKPDLTPLYEGIKKLLNDLATG